MNDKTADLVTAHRSDVHSPPPDVLQRWHDAIDEAAARENRDAARGSRGKLDAASVFVGMAIAAALALGIGIGYFLPGEPSSNAMYDGVAVNTTDTSVATTPAALSRGLQVHFRDSRQQILRLPDSGDRAALVLQIVGQNRLFESAAEKHNAPELARVLRALEPVLLQLAASDLDSMNARQLQTQLAFELNVMLTKLASESSNDSQTT